MPCLKQVKKLCDICAFCFNKAMLDYFESRNTSSEAPPENLILFMRSIFLENVQSIICDTLLQNLNDYMKLHEYQKVMFIKLYKHYHMIRFNLQFKLPNIAGLYEEYLLGLNNLIVLNLTKVCTDEILDVVGKNCPLLEVIYIVSKTESVSNKNGREINALKLKFFVSDAGLGFLHNCKYLKKIYMDKIIRSCCGGRKITHDGLRSLLYALPNIRYISYEDMGSVLEGWNPSSRGLSLVHVHDNHVTPEHISLFNFLCPSLRILCLSIPTVVRDPNIPTSCLEVLAGSNLSVKCLVLKSFPFDISLQKYLEAKGENLNSLLLDHESSITTQSLSIIAINCKNLEHLAVKLLHSTYSDNALPQSSDIKCFTTLKSLKLFGIKWNPNIIFPLCLYNSKKLELLSLFNKYYDERLDDTFEILALKNALSCLRKLWLLDGFILSSKAVVNFVLGCKIIREVTFKADSGFDKYFDEIIIKNNLDLTIKTETFANFGYCLCQN